MSVAASTDDIHTQRTLVTALFFETRLQWFVVHEVMKKRFNGAPGLLFGETLGPKIDDQFGLARSK